MTFYLKDTFVLSKYFHEMQHSKYFKYQNCPKKCIELDWHDFYRRESQGLRMPINLENRVIFDPLTYMIFF